MHPVEARGDHLATTPALKPYIHDFPIAGGLGKDEREFLARVLREKLESPDR